MSRAVHSEHATLLASAERGVIQIVVEHQQIARFGFQRDVARKVAWSYSKSSCERFGSICFVLIQ